MSLLACVPNVSEARRKDVIQAISDSISSVRGVRLLDITSDTQNNRTVFTFVGLKAAVRKGALALLETAIEHIDIKRHQGDYPRMGIVDVIPFVPLEDTPMERAIALANEAAEQIAEHFSIPVYMYDYAAKKEERRSLQFIRKGEFEGFKEKIHRPEWKPDYGPQNVHPTAGVTTVGARYPLVALNMLFDTEDRDAVDRIAAALLKEFEDFSKLKLQVINPRGYSGWKIAATVLDYKTIMLCDLVNAATRLAESFDIDYDGTELVGLVTGDALFDCLERHLMLRNFNPLQVLDFHIRKK
jgi:glutamate formiminotransferase